MKRNLNINVHEITRVEGHGNIVIDIKKGKIKKLKLEIIESPRFFEAMLRGRRFDEAQHIMSRICGICAVSHTSASLKAIESAMGIKISRQSLLLRKLAFNGENLQSHILHIYFLVLPDLLGVGSVVPLISSHPKVAKMALELKRLSNEICAVVAGRHIHPIALFPGGVTYTPRQKELKDLRTKLAGSLDDLDRTLELFASLPFPQMRKERELVSLKAKGEYAFYDGQPVSSDGYDIGVEGYTDKVMEYIVSHSVAKHAKTKSGTFMVGAMARVHNNYRQLKPRAKKAAKRLGLVPPLANPFSNNHAQLVECIHATEDSIDIIDKLLEAGPKPEPLKKPAKWGRGIGIVEAPRGTLYHDYTINKDGLIEEANCIIPTAQNLRSMEDDLRAFVPEILDRPKEEIRNLVEMLVRAYDPCISCSTHIMDVKFK